MNKLSRIVYAEDEPDIAEICKISLTSIGGFEVVHCVNGIEVLNELENQLPDLFLLDMMMPDMDGITTLKELKNNSQTKNIPVVFMTAKVQKNEIEGYLDMGAIEVITKPFDPMSLPDKLNQIWNDFYE